MVLNNVTKFHKILIKGNRLRERMSLDRRMDMRTKVLCPYVQVDGWTGVTLNAPAIVMGGGHKKGHNLVKILLLSPISNLTCIL